MDAEFETCVDERIVSTTLGRWRICGNSILYTLYAAELYDLDGRTAHSCGSAAADSGSGTDSDSSSHAANSDPSTDIDAHLGTDSNCCSSRNLTAAGKLDIANEHNWPADAYHDKSCG